MIEKSPLKFKKTNHFVLAVFQTLGILYVDFIDFITQIDSRVKVVISGISCACTTVPISRLYTDRGLNELVETGFPRQANNMMPHVRYIIYGSQLNI